MLNSWLVVKITPNGLQVYLVEDLKAQTFKLVIT